MRKINLFVLFCIIALNSIAQQTQVSGKCYDNVTEKPISDVFIQVIPVSDPHSYYSAISNLDGSFKINVQSGSYKLIAHILGYINFEQTITISSGTTNHFECKMEKNVLALGEIKVTSLMQNKILKDIIAPLEVLEKNKIAQLSENTLPGLLINTPGISKSSDGIWATSINIRGFGEQKYVTLIDGCRVETATDISAGLSMIDPSDIERIEIIKGAASSLYGTGAMGGVLNIYTKDASYKETPYFRANLSSGYQSVNSMLHESAQIFTGGKSWNLKLSGMYRKAENIQTPQGEMENSRFQDQNISAKLKVKPKENHEAYINMQSFTANDVGLPGGSAFPSSATVKYPIETRFLVNTGYSIKPEDKLLKEISFNVFHQYILRDVIMNPNAPPTLIANQRITALKIIPKGMHNTNGINFKTNWQLNKHKVIAGIDVWQRRFESEREKFIQIEVLDSVDNVLATNELIKGEIPNPKSEFTSMGFFIQDDISIIPDKLDLLFGARIDRIHVHNDEATDPYYQILNGTRNDNPPGQKITFEENTVADYSWSGNFGVNYNLINNIDITLNLAKSFRAPTLEERFKYIDLGGLVKLGDPNLKPENGLFTDFGIKVWDNNIIVKANVFYNRLNNMIVEESGEFIYSYTATNQYDTLPALINTNVNEAELYGFDFEVKYRIINSFIVTANASYVRGIDITEDKSLPQISPFYSYVEFQNSFFDLINVSASVNMAADQPKIATGEIATSGYAVYNISVFSKPLYFGRQNIQLYAGVNNIFDREYTNHLATNRGSISIEPGRNVYAKISYQF